MRYLRISLMGALVTSVLGWSAPAFARSLVELVRTPADHPVVLIEALRSPSENPTALLFSVQNRGANCGFGTPASIYQVDRDPANGTALGLQLNDTLDRIQSTRYALFEAPDGTLFTGGGWCGFKPPYYSTDQGNSFDPATRGVGPPNSTFSFVAFRGEVYAGTGYEPYDAEIYRWLGTSGPNYWERVLGLDPPRTILTTMAVHNDHLFVGSQVYYYNGAETCADSVPVRISADGRSFRPTSGIPGCESIQKLLNVDGKLVAWAQGVTSTRFSSYVWNPKVQRWNLVARDVLSGFQRGANVPIVAYKCILIAYGVAPGESEAKLFVSHDLGRSWGTFFRVPIGPNISALAVNGDEFLAGTWGDENGIARIYTVSLVKR